ncbi:rho-related protein racB isoform X2 [Daphnia magna]|uniref:rho-related protein racB isoform X2 n=1 Tax=Daphnia magna TaxID=35525 RepID=UPI001E1BB0E8|nr:rho-related protein racB isoform X2 [Daphnia magna]
MNRNRVISVVIVGDTNTGKNCIFTNFKENSKDYPLEYVPTVFDNSSKTIQVDGVYYHVSLSYTSGQTEYDGLRILSYPSTDVFLLCYAVSNRTSFESVPSKWIPELKLHSPHTPIVLVGTKIDMRKGGSTSTDCCRRQRNEQKGQCFHRMLGQDGRQYARGFPGGGASGAVQIKKKRKPKTSIMWLRSLVNHLILGLRNTHDSRMYMILGLLKL